MPKNKLALIRYKVLDSCFRNITVKYSFADLLNAVNKTLEEYDSSANGVSKSTLYEDIKYMESENGWSIDLNRIREGKYVYYRYLDPKYSINNMPLTEDELENLKYAVDTLSQFKGMPQFLWLEEMIAKLEQGISNKQKTIIAFDSNIYLRGISWLGELYSAILHEKVMEIVYQDYKSLEAYVLIIHPYYLKQHNNRWFLFGYNSEKDAIWTLALDRIKEIKITKYTYDITHQENWDEYFEDIIGVTLPYNKEDQVIEQVKFFVGYPRANYIITKPLHGSQKIEKVENGIIVKLELIINKELISLILSYGKDIKVLQPESLKQSIIDNLKGSLSEYQI